MPNFLAVRRWFAAKSGEVERVEIGETVEIQDGDKSFVLALLRVHMAGEDGQGPQLYALPLSAAWETGKEDLLQRLVQYAVAKLRRRSKMGVLYDAVADEDFSHSLLAAMSEGREVKMSRGEIRFTRTNVFDALAGEDAGASLQVRRSGVEQTNTSIILGERLVLKLYRRLQRGTNPDLEVGRFLTEVARFENTPPLAGAAEYHAQDGEPTTLAVVQGFVPNQGDGWSYVLDRLAMYLEDQLISPYIPDNGDEAAEQEGPDEAEYAFFLSLMRTLGYRTGELHKAFATPTDDPAFRAEPVPEEEFRGWTEAILEEGRRTMRLLQRRRDGLAEEARAEAEELLERRKEVGKRVREIAKMKIEAFKTRHHGDYHLGQVLVSNNDFQIIDFEGEPARPLEERRKKHSPLRDVAGMVRSFNYAAHAALQNVSAERMDNYDEMRGWAADWERRVREAFLEGYEGGIAGCPSYPEDRGQAGALIELFTLEKALYEIRYELDNRPDWVSIPVRGILGLLDDRTGEEPS